VVAGAVSGGIMDAVGGLFKGVWAANTAQRAFEQIIVNPAVNAVANFIDWYRTRSGNYLVSFGWSTACSLASLLLPYLKSLLL
jgi:hypothetical protein